MAAVETEARTRTITWDDPMIGAERAKGMRGIDYLRAIVSGEVPRPPVAWALDFAIDEVEEGRVSFAMVPSEIHYNPIGVVHGGVAATLCDSAMGSAVHTLLPAGVGYTSVDLAIKFLRPVTRETGRIVATATVLNAGKRTALAEARLTDAAGKLLAHATSTCLILRP